MRREADMDAYNICRLSRRSWRVIERELAAPEHRELTNILLLAGRLGLLCRGLGFCRSSLLGRGFFGRGVLGRGGLLRGRGSLQGLLGGGGFSGRPFGSRSGFGALDRSRGLLRALGGRL